MAGPPTGCGAVTVKFSRPGPGYQRARMSAAVSPDRMSSPTVTLPFAGTAPEACWPSENCANWFGRARPPVFPAMSTIDRRVAPISRSSRPCSSGDVPSCAVEVPKMLMFTTTGGFGEPAGTHCCSRM